MTVPTPTAGVDQPTWLLDAQWPVFAGHFPSHPVLPGALLLDWVVSAITAQHSRPVGLQAASCLSCHPGGAVP